MSIALVTITQITNLPIAQIGNVLYPATVIVRQMEVGPTGAPGVGLAPRAMVASEALAGGDLVNLWNDAGTPKVRLAKASAKGYEANGFVLAPVGSGGTGTVNFIGTDTAMSGLTAGKQWLSTTPGKSQSTAPTGSGVVVQRVGFALSSTDLMFQPQLPISLSL